MNILTFDIEDWFHILRHPATADESKWVQYPSRIHENMDKIFAILDKHNLKATFFCLGWIARKYPEIIRAIDEGGHEVASHSDMHVLSYEQTRKQFREDISRSIHHLEDIIGKKIRAYRAPGFSLKKENKWVFELLIENGIEIDCSIFPAARSHGGFKDFGIERPCIVDINGSRIKEFPINVRRLFNKDIIYSGGGYFRLYPIFLLDRWFKESDYNMTYFHPRDFDPDQPMLPNLTPLRKFKTYYGLKQAYSKFERLVTTFPTMDLETADKMVDWDKAPVKYL